MKLHALGVLTASVLLMPGLYAETEFSISLDTSPLVGHAAQPFYLDFQFNDGSGTGDANNTALVYGFDFGGGSAGSDVNPFGGASGSLTSGVNLTDSSFLNELFQDFIPGAYLAFNIQLTTEVDPGPQPDEFSFGILDCSQTAIPTTGPADALLTIDVSSPLNVQTYAGDANRPLGCNAGPGIALAAPVVSPEPGTRWLFASGLGTLAAAVFAWKKRRVSDV